MARFKREAQVLASLNHPNIATIYGFEESDGIRALAMELVEGQTLAEIVGARHGVPETEALPIAKQIADALEYAHQSGIIHRDLKPANVKVTPEGTVKVLDFGLAKVLEAADPSSSSSNVSNSLTLTVAATQAGVTIGTAAYMSPEQARGKAADRRADIWAFGAVLYEMLAGKRLFEGETVSETLAAVLKTEPDWSTLLQDLPPKIHELVRRCLVKDPKQRLQSIGDARIAIEETITGDGGTGQGFPQGEAALPPPYVVWRRVLLVSAGVAMGAILMALVFTSGVFRKPAPKPQEIRFTIPPPEGYTLPNDLPVPQIAVSPDGRKIVFTAGDSKGNTSLWVRALGATVAQQLENTDGADGPFWSPDSQSIGFVAKGKLIKIPAAGGSPQTLCDVGSYTGGAWGPSGEILFGQWNGPLMRVAAEGGQSAPVVEFDYKNYIGYAAPHFLPDGNQFLYFAANASLSSNENAVFVGSLDAKQKRLLFKSQSAAQFYPPGHLLFVRGGVLMAQVLDLNKMELSGQPVRIADNIRSSTLGAADFSVSSVGILSYRKGGTSALGTSQLT